MLRTNENLSACFAVRGKFSEISRPGTFVLIGLYGPRISTGAFGFMSNVSSWDGPPINIKRIQFVSFGGVAAAARSANQSVRLSPRAASDPACRKSRLRSPSQNSTGRSASRRNMIFLPANRFYHSRSIYECFPRKKRKQPAQELGRSQPIRRRSSREPEGQFFPSSGPK